MSVHFDHRVVRQWRNDSDFTAERVCALVQQAGARCSFDHLRDLETGKSQPSLRLLEALAAVYQRDPRELFTPAEDDASEASTDPALAGAA